jgi:hypothetical protein
VHAPHACLLCHPPGSPLLLATPVPASAGRVPAAIVPDLMRAAGHYLSQGEAELVVNHLHFLASSRPAGQAQEGEAGGPAGAGAAGGLAGSAGSNLVDFAAFLEVFVNHRPAAGRGAVTLAQVQEAFAELGDGAVLGGGCLGAWVALGCVAWAVAGGGRMPC